MKLIETSFEDIRALTLLQDEVIYYGLTIQNNILEPFKITSNNRGYYWDVNKSEWADYISALFEESQKSSIKTFYLTEED